MDNLQVTSFANINLKDPFFDSLRANYDGFDDWFNNKASSGANALVYYNNAALLDFLYLKDENEAYDFVPPQSYVYLDLNAK